MAYFIDLFSPETYEAFKRSDQRVSGFRVRQRRAAERVRAGDKFLCYVTRLGRWFGVLEVLDGPVIDDTPIFYPEDDPFVVRFQVRPLVVLDAEQAIPIYEDEVWSGLSFTREHARGTSTWTGRVRRSLVVLDEPDGDLLERLLLEQSRDPRTFPIDAEQYRRFAGFTVRGAEKDIVVTVPEEVDEPQEPASVVQSGSRESHVIQALIADIGARMGMSIWVPRNDRAAVDRERKFRSEEMVDRLPLNYDETTLTTIQNIDILWLRGRSIARAFEVEHTTAVYSGILRMADLLALQPNMDIKLHIVAPQDKREKVFQEIRRPVFSLLDRGPLAERCTYISYDSLRELAEQPNLEHMRDSVLEEYAEDAD